VSGQVPPRNTQRATATAATISRFTFEFHSLARVRRVSLKDFVRYIRPRALHSRGSSRAPWRVSSPNPCGHPRSNATFLKDFVLRSVPWRVSVYIP
jgi:hypothetical protein